MTDNDVHIAVCDWLANVLGIPAILAYQGGNRPAETYAAVALQNVRELRERDMTTTYAEADDDVTATPLIDTEWEFNVTVWGDEALPPIRRLRSSMQINAVANKLHPLTPHEMGRINALPEHEYGDEVWRSRATAPLFVRGITRDGLVIDTIDTVPFAYNGRSGSVNRPA